MKIEQTMLKNNNLVDRKVTNENQIAEIRYANSEIIDLNLEKIQTLAQDQKELAEVRAALEEDGSNLSGLAAKNKNEAPVLKSKQILKHGFIQKLNRIALALGVISVANNSLEANSKKPVDKISDSIEASQGLPNRQAEIDQAYKFQNHISAETGDDLKKEALLLSVKDHQAFLERAREFIGVGGLDLNKEILKIAKEDPDVFIYKFEAIKDLPSLDLNKLVSEAAKEKPSYFFTSISNFQDVEGLDLAPLVTEAAAKDPNSFLMSVGWHLHIYNRLDTLDLAGLIDKAAEQDPVAVFQCQIEKFSDILNIDLPKIITRAAQKNPGGLIFSLPDLKDIPGINFKDLVINLADKAPEAILNYPNYLLYIDGLNVNEFITKAAPQDPKSFFKNIANLKDYPGVDLVKLVQESALKEPVALLENIYNVRDIAGINLPALMSQALENNPDAQAKILSFAQEDPGYFLAFASVLSEVKGLDINKLALAAINSNARGFLENLESLQDLKGLDINRLVHSALVNDLDYLLDNVNRLKNISRLDLADIVPLVASHDPARFLLQAVNFQGIANLDLASLVVTAASESPATFIREVEQFKNIIDLKSLDLMPILRQEPVAFMQNLPTFKKLPNVDIAELINSAAEKDPALFLNFAGVLDNILNLDLSRLIKEAATKRPDAFWKNIHNLDGRSFNLTELINSVANENPEEAINNVTSFANFISEDNLKSILNKATENNPALTNKIAELSGRNPDFLCRYFSVLKTVPNLDVTGDAKKMLNKNPALLMPNFDKFKDLEGLDISELLTRAASQNAANFFIFFDSFKNVKDLNLAPIIETAAQNDPSSFFDRANVVASVPGFDCPAEVRKMADKYPEIFLNYANVNFNSGLQNILSPQELADLTNAALGVTINSISNGNQEEKERANNSLSKFSSRFVYNINNLHERPDGERFASTEKLSAKSLYSIMVYGEQEIYTSSFNGCFDRLVGKKGTAGKQDLVGKMETEKLNGRDLLDQVSDNKFRTFIKECTWFNRLDDFLATMDESAANEILKNVVKNLDKSENKLDNALTLAEIFGSTKNPKTLQVLQNQIKVEYERVSGDGQAKLEDKTMHGLLAGMFSDNAVTDKEWFQKISQEYEIAKVASLDTKELFNEAGVCTQRYHFFESGDNDGIYSFDHFVSQYKGDTNNWSVNEKNPHYVIISSKRGDKQINIYANNPRFRDYNNNGAQEIDELMSKNKLITNLYSYRGHSFGFSLRGISPETKIINIGSCGGFNRISEILNVSPDGHIISTKGTGTKFVNDPLFKDLNDAILSDKDGNIEWRDFWQEETNKLGGNENFKNYVGPHENQGMIYLRAFNKKMSTATNAETVVQAQ